MSKTPVSILQEMMVKNKITPNYELIHDGGGSHMNVFAYQVKCDDLIASGIGRSKKDAKHEAAKAMLETIATKRGYLQLPASPAQSPIRTPLLPIIPEISRIPPDIPFVNAVGALQVSHIYLSKYYIELYRYRIISIYINNYYRICVLKIIYKILSISKLVMLDLHMQRFLLLSVK